MKTIAILNASEDERASIKASILANTAHRDELKFIEYSIGKRHKADLLAEINGDVLAGTIHLIIMSDWVETGWEHFSCTEITGFCRKAIPDFPVITTTGVEVQEEEIQYIIPSMVYPNKFFFNAEDPVAKDMVKEIDRLLFSEE